jgi:2'-5' RNA ligase
MQQPEGVRVFVGLKIAPAIAGELARLAGALQGPAIRHIAVPDVHLTLVPPWTEASVPQAIEKLRDAAVGIAPFRLAFRRLGYGPQSKRPRLLWAECATTDAIDSAHAALLQAYGQPDERRPFRPHVTLARIRGNGAAIARRRPIDQELSLTQQIDSIELFQSPPQAAHGYQILASIPLGQRPALASDGGEAP